MLGNDIVALRAYLSTIGEKFFEKFEILKNFPVNWKNFPVA